MAKLQVLLEVVPTAQGVPLAAMAASGGLASATELFSFAEQLLADMPSLGVEVTDAFGPVPLAAADPALGPVAEGPAVAAVGTSAGRRRRGVARTRDRDAEDAPPPAHVASMIVPCEVSAAALAAIEDREDVVVWPNSPIMLFNSGSAAEEELSGLFDLATSAGGTDCHPFRPGVTVGAVRALLGVEAIWRDGFRGQNIVVGILDEGVNRFYPVVGGHETLTERRWGLAGIESHGSMCAADILVAAPPCASMITPSSASRGRAAPSRCSRRCSTSVDATARRT